MWNYILEEENLFCHYNSVNKLMFIQYKNVLAPHLTAQAYQWMNEALPHIDTLHGAVFDFSHVRKFEPANISTAKNRSVALNQRHDLSRIPAALLVGNAFQERMLALSIKMTPEEERKRLVYRMEDALDFIESFNAAQGIETFVSHPVILNTKRCTSFYDDVTQRIQVSYYGTVTPLTTINVYRWIGELIKAGNLAAIKGAIFDFRLIAGFDNANLSTVRKNSKELNFNYDMSHIAVGLIATSLRQEHMLRLTLKVTPQETRKKLVRSFAEAMQFVERFHAEYSQQPGAGAGSSVIDN